MSGAEFAPSAGTVRVASFLSLHLSLFGQGGASKTDGAIREWAIKSIQPVMTTILWME